MPTDSSSSRSRATRCSAERPRSPNTSRSPRTSWTRLAAVTRPSAWELPPSSRIARVARQVSRLGQVDLAVGEQGVDVVGRGLDLVHPRPARGHHVLGVVLVGGQAHRGGLHPQRNVLAHQRDSPAFGGEVSCATQDPGVVAVGAETGGQHRRVGVVELDVQRAALRPNGNRLIEAPVLEPEVVEQAQRLAGEPAQLVMVPFGLEFADHHQRNHHFVFGEPAAGPGIGQQYGRVEHVSPDFGHVALLERGKPARTRTGVSAGTAAPGPGPVLPFV